MGMALTSPGVEVSVIDESFYTPAEPGTTPLIVVATGQDKANAAGTGTASATLKANVNKAFKVTSQRELTDIYGVPFFEKTVSSSPVHGSERNEYGLLAAYSLLGVSNAAFVVRADVNVDELSPNTSIPGANPTNGQWWVDTTTTTWGIQEWNGASASTSGGQRFATKTPIVLTDDDEAKVASGVPKTSVGAIGDYAIVFQTVDGTGTFTASREEATLWYKSIGNTEAGVAAGDWVLVGSNDWASSHPTVQGANFGTPTGGTLTINGTAVSVSASASITTVVATINGLGIGGTDEATGVTAKAVSGKIYLYTNASNDEGDTPDSTLSNAIVIGGTVTGTGLTAGTYYGPALQQSTHTNVPEWKSGDSNPRPTGSVWVKTTQPNGGANWRVSSWNEATETWVSTSAPLYASTTAANYFLDRTGGGVNLPIGSLFVQTNSSEHSGYDATPETAKFKVWYRANTGNTTMTSAVITTGSLTGGTNTFTIAESLKTSATVDTAKTVSFTALGTAADADLMAAAVNAAGFTNVEASVNADNKVLIFHKLGGDFRITDGTATPVANVFTAYNINTLQGTNMYALPAGADEDWVATNWRPFAAYDFKAKSIAPTNEPADGQLWYNPTVGEIDLMVHDGNKFDGYLNVYASTDPEGPLVSATEPADGDRSDGGNLADNDIWVDTSNLEDFPKVYRYQYSGTADEGWYPVDVTDQTTEDGILFADARFGSSGATGNTAATIIDLLSTDYVDVDSPDPDLYPKGMLLWNTRRSYGNVKRYSNNHVDTTALNVRYGNQSMSGYATDRWVTASPNAEDGSGQFGRKAQRAVVVAALKSTIDTSQEIRDEERRNFNIIACPGYPEVMTNLVNLNTDRGLTAFVVGDTPLRLASDATTLTNWGTNANLVTDNSDAGLVTYDEYIGVFYPNGFTTDLSGTNAVVPASHMMLKTIALSDNASYPWFAPAGTRRGGITNATSVGYIQASTGEFQTVALNEGQRDTLYNLKVNPITFFNGVGLINFGQKTRARNASALDRINVSRLVVYLRSQLDKLARPYIFEPNDKITRDEVKQAVESLLLELVGLRALYDFAVVCDETNNTAARIDRNELWVDIAIEPVKAVEFIYIPLRVKNTGEI
jgi:hypothetical protein